MCPWLLFARPLHGVRACSPSIHLTIWTELQHDDNVADFFYTDSDKWTLDNEIYEKIWISTSQILGTEIANKVLHFGRSANFAHSKPQTIAYLCFVSAQIFKPCFFVDKPSSSSKCKYISLSGCFVFVIGQCQSGQHIARPGWATYMCLDQHPTSICFFCREVSRPYWKM